MKFIHTVDIYFDSVLPGLAAYKDAPADLRRADNTRDPFTRLVDTAIEESVSFIASAGKNLPHRETHAQA